MSRRRRGIRQSPGGDLSVAERQRRRAGELLQRRVSFARRQYDALLQQGVAFDHQWCGVSQLAYDDKSGAKIANMLKTDWPQALAMAADRETLSGLCGVDTGFGGITYPKAVGSVRPS